jgi:hypothetical protein
MFTVDQLGFVVVNTTGKKVCDCWQKHQQADKAKSKQYLCSDSPQHERYFEPTQGKEASNRYLSGVPSV